jgi:hypothetical protein
MRYLLLMALATVLVSGGCSNGSSSSDGGADAGPVDFSCDKGKTAGAWELQEPDDLAGLRGFTEIEGSIIVSCPSCTGLEDLRCLEDVSGDLIIENCYSLETLGGLENLVNVGRLNIHTNPSLVTLNGFEAVQSMGSLSILENEELKAISGLNSLTNLNCLQVESNPKLETISGFGGLESVSAIIISGNGSLEELDGFESLIETSSLEIEDNDSLIDLDGLSGLSVAPWISIDGNSSLGNIDGLGSLKFPLYYLNISGADSLSKLTTMPDSSNVDLKITNNDSLVDLEGLEGFTGLANLRLESNVELSNIDGLLGVEYIGWGQYPGFSAGVISIKRTGLTDLHGLSNAVDFWLTELRIERNWKMTGVEGLEGLVGMHYEESFVAGCDSPGVITVSENNLLTNLDGLSGLQILDDVNVIITDNAFLPDCEACDLLDQLASVPTSIDVQDNLDDTCTPVPANCP